MDKIILMVKSLENYCYCKSRCSFLEKEMNLLVQGNVSDGREKMEKELSQLRHLLDVVDTSLEMVGDFSKRYKIIIESRYLKNVRMEDLADMTHISRSRCYELCKEAVAYMAKIAFGEN